MDRATSTGHHLRVGTLNVRSTQGGNLESTLKSFRQMKVDVAVLTETKLTNDKAMDRRKGSTTSPRRDFSRRVWSTSGGRRVNTGKSHPARSVLQFDQSGPRFIPGSRTTDHWVPCCTNAFNGQRHLLHQHPERLGQHKIDFFSPTPHSGPRRWTVDTPPVCCPVPLCPYEADTVTALFRHMAARHPEDEVQVEGYPGYYKCPECNQYVKGATPTQRHLRSATCKRGRKRRQAKEAEEALSDALSDLPTFYIEGREVERVESFTYLGRELTTSDNDLQACMRNLAKAKAKWGAISRVLKRDGATVPYRSRIYLIVVATVLLYGSETWVVTDRMKAALESFHHGCARHITRKYIHRVGDEEAGDEFWVYPSTAEVLRQANLKPITDYLTKRRAGFYDILTYVFHQDLLSLRHGEQQDIREISHDTIHSSSQYPRKILKPQSRSRYHSWPHGALNG